MDSAALLAQLPLPAGQSRTVPVTVSAGVRATHAAEEIFSAEICLECVSQEAAGPLLQDGSNGGGGGTGSAVQMVQGRHAVLPVQAHVQPSAQIVQVGFRDIWLPARQAAGAAAAGAAAPGASGSSSSTFERRCVMEVAVSNRGRYPLQVRFWSWAAKPGWACPPPLSAGARGWGGGRAGRRRARAATCQAGTMLSWHRFCTRSLNLRSVGPASRSHQLATCLHHQVYPAPCPPCPAPQVWLGPAVADASQLVAAAATDSLLPQAVPPAAAGVPTVGSLPPGRRCTVAYILDASHSEPGSGADASGTGSGSSGPLSMPLSSGSLLPAASARVRPGATWEEQQRQACAERLSRALALFYRVDAEEAGLAGGASWLPSAPLSVPASPGGCRGGCMLAKRGG